MVYRRVAVLAGLLLTAAPFFAPRADAQGGGSLSLSNLRRRLETAIADL